MAKRSRKTRMNFGSPPSAHMKNIRRLIHNITTNAEKAKVHAKGGRCDMAQLYFEDAFYYMGGLHAHIDSVGKHGYVVKKAAKTNLPARAQIAARKALETYCGRAK